MSIGFPTWADKLNPCYACWCELSNWATYRGVSAATWPFQKKEETSYDAACAACEIKVRVVAVVILTRIIALLKYNKTAGSTAPRGRALLADLPELHLMKHDRLEPSRELQNVGDLTNQTELPITLTFWRRSRETATRHRNPLFRDPRICTNKAIMGDELHTMHLGVFQSYIARVFSAAIDEDVYNIGATDKVTRKALTVARLRVELMEWYSVQRQNNPSTPIYALTDLVPTMISEKSLGTKAAETGSLLPFAVDLVRRNAAVLRSPKVLFDAGEYLLRYLRITRNNPRKLPTSAHQDGWAQKADIVSCIWCRFTLPNLRFELWPGQFNPLRGDISRHRNDIQFVVRRGRFGSGGRELPLPRLSPRNHKPMPVRRPPFTTRCFCTGLCFDARIMLTTHSSVKL